MTTENFKAFTLRTSIVDTDEVVGVNTLGTDNIRIPINVLQATAPTSDEKAALDGADSPSGTNAFVTSSVLNNRIQAYLKSISALANLAAENVINGCLYVVFDDSESNTMKSLLYVYNDSSTEIDDGLNSITPTSVKAKKPMPKNGSGRFILIGERDVKEILVQGSTLTIDSTYINSTLICDTSLNPIVITLPNIDDFPFGYFLNFTRSSNGHGTVTIESPDSRIKGLHSIELLPFQSVQLVKAVANVETYWCILNEGTPYVWGSVLSGQYLYSPDGLNIVGTSSAGYWNRNSGILTPSTSTNSVNVPAGYTINDGVNNVGISKSASGVMRLSVGAAYPIMASYLSPSYAFYLDGVTACFNQNASSDLGANLVEFKTTATAKNLKWIDLTTVKYYKSGIGANVIKTTNATGVAGISFDMGSTAGADFSYGGVSAFQVDTNGSSITKYNALQGINAYWNAGAKVLVTGHYAWMQQHFDSSNLVREWQSTSNVANSSLVPTVEKRFVSVGSYPTSFVNSILGVIALQKLTGIITNGATYDTGISCAAGNFFDFIVSDTTNNVRCKFGVTSGSMAKSSDTMYMLGSYSYIQGNAGTINIYPYSGQLRVENNLGVSISLSISVIAQVYS